MAVRSVRRYVVVNGRVITDTHNQCLVIQVTRTTNIIAHVGCVGGCVDHVDHTVDHILIIVIIRRPFWTTAARDHIVAIVIATSVYVVEPRRRLARAAQS